MREILKRQIEKLYPGVRTRSDFDILQLSGGAYDMKGDVYTWLDQEYNYLVDAYGGGSIGRQRLEEEVGKAMAITPERSNRQ